MSRVRATLVRCFPIAGATLAAILVAGASSADEGGLSLVSSADRRTAAGQRSVVAYSFHGSLRCTTCLLVERGAEEAIRGSFADKLVEGSLAWRSVNIRLPENRHFAAEYDVLSWALVLVEYHGETPGQWRTLSLAGELVHADPDAFRRYVTAEVLAFFKNAPR